MTQAMSTPVGPAGDCERIVDGMLNQPVNTISCLAFVVAGVLVLVLVRRQHSMEAPDVLIAGMLILTGFGSAAFHGFGGRVAIWVHDASLAGLLALMVSVEVFRRTRRRWDATPWWVAWAGIGILAGFLPSTTSMIAAGAAVAAFLLVLAPARWSQPDSRAAMETDRRRALLLPVALLAVGYVVFWLSRTGGPLCDPDSLLQGHAVWHLFVGAGLAVYGVRIGRAAPSAPRS